MELQELLDDYGVAVRSRGNDLGLVFIGPFSYDGAALAFATKASQVPGVRIPSYGPLFHRLDHTEVNLNIGDKHPLFLAAAK
jgi:hypothetical protein